jgi:tRNA(Ile)-lysidine synthase
VATLATLAPALRRRVLRLAALAAGSPGSDLFHVHVVELDRLVTDWHGQGPVQLPGPVGVRRVAGALIFDQTAVGG